MEIRYRTGDEAMSAITFSNKVFDREVAFFFKRVKVSKELCELRNMINVGYLITRMAIERKESRGLHYTIDYPVHAYDKK